MGEADGPRARRRAAARGRDGHAPRFLPLDGHVHDQPPRMTTRLYLVRHGATQLTAEDRFAGSIGVELSDEGRWQAKQLGERLRDEGITASYCSPLSRSADTARIIAGECGLTSVHSD